MANLKAAKNGQTPNKPTVVAVELISTEIALILL